MPFFTVSFRSESGTFLIRRSAKDSALVLSLMTEPSRSDPNRPKVAHYKIVEENNIFYIQDNQGTEMRFPSLATLLQHYENPDKKQRMGLPVALKRVLPFVQQ